MSTQHVAASSGRTIVVIGGGIAGLLTAAACAPHADRVVVVERDALPTVQAPGPAHRRHFMLTACSPRAAWPWRAWFLG